MGNASIHLYRRSGEDQEISLYGIQYLTPYSLLLNPIGNCFSVWKNMVIRGGYTNENQLWKLITEKFGEISFITADHFIERCRVIWGGVPIRKKSTKNYIVINLCYYL
ncbi:hypothetical protein RF11_07424 [Thelohanellus kitauei]|uniref:Uncharacterized protein n=1 Tax=Thelohanellus kitauei TaxID=669202 RepID=A0A0C2NLJ7_THEKT|nr:hypothetical protein RF11_07424 [Thelohanellus kitauei]